MIHRRLPIIFVSVGDPVASGVVGSVAHPESNTTGITNLFPSITGKWLELLKEAAPQIMRVALIFNPEFLVTGPYLASIEMAAAAIAVKTTRVPVRNASEIERAIDTFATEPNGGLIPVPAPLVDSDRALIARLAIRHRLPMMSFERRDVAAGGLISYGPNTPDLYRKAADYVDRILHGGKTGELPVQFPTTFELVINLKTAKTIGLVIPEALIARADEVIE